jgi:5-methylthioribose kinase
MCRFDVTPAKYITGIITEKGVIHPKEDGTFDIAAFLLNGDKTTTPNDDISKPEAAVVEDDISEYKEQTVASLPSYLANNVPEAMKILNATTADELEAVEMGDGNLNLVFIISSKKDSDPSVALEPAKKIIVKQALPYVRCVGESWPLTLDRAFYEYTALQAQKKACPEHVPNLYYFSKKDALIVMEYLAPPIQILRKGLIAGIRYNTMASDMGNFCAKTLFRTSGFALSTTELRKRVEFWSTNSMMCALTEQVVFTEPYIVASNNRWTTPYLDNDKKAIETNTTLQLAAAKWKMKFVTNTEALIHADLHTGSVMCANVTDHQTYVIDPEFAFYGPAAFDTGAFIANLLLSYVSQRAHRSNDNLNSDYDEWILEQIVVFWNTFVAQFTKYWNDPTEYTGYMYDCIKDTLIADDTILKQCQDQYMQHFLCDTIGFAGMKMLRRIVGIAHVEDLESITDLELRSVCERRGLRIAQHFIIHGCDSSAFKSIEDVVAFVRSTE